MHPLRLLRIALEAERLRIGLHLRRTAGRVVMGVIALALSFGALVFGHVAAWYWLRRYFLPEYVGLIFFGTDLVVALVFFTLAFRSSPGLAESEALAVRRQAMQQVGASLTMTALIARVLEQLVRLRRQR